MLNVSLERFALLTYDVLPFLDIHVQQILGTRTVPWQKDSAYQEALFDEYGSQVVERPWRIPEAMYQQNALARSSARSGEPLLRRIPLQFGQCFSGLKVAPQVQLPLGFELIRSKIRRIASVLFGRSTSIKQSRAAEQQ